MAFLAKPQTLRTAHRMLGANSSVKTTSVQHKNEGLYPGEMLPVNRRTDQLCYVPSKMYRKHSNCWVRHTRGVTILFKYDSIGIVWNLKWKNTSENIFTLTTFFSLLKRFWMIQAINSKIKWTAILNLSEHLVSFWMR